MFLCKYCSRSFSRKDALKRHGDCRHVAKTCNQCGAVLKSEGALQRHLTETHHQGPQRKETKATPHPLAKRPRLDLENEPSTSASTRYCKECNLNIATALFAGHLRSQEHSENCCVDQGEDIQVVHTCFKNRLVTYRINGRQDPTNVEGFLTALKEKFLKLVGDFVKNYVIIKIGIVLFGRFVLQAKEIAEIKSFNTKFRLVSGGTDLQELYCQLKDIVNKKATQFEECDSGWALQQLLHLDISINKVNPLNASSYIPLPKEIRDKKAVVNIRNETDEKCFMWSVLAALHPVRSSDHPSRVTKYSDYKSELDFTGIQFPVSLQSISKFEQLNNISINVYGLEETYKNDKNIIEVVGPLYFSRSYNKNRHVNLLLISNDSGKNHYCLIKDMSRLISSQINNSGHSKYLCDGCLVYYTTEQKLNDHQNFDCGHVVAKCPTTNKKQNKYGEEMPENMLKFTNFERKLKIPFVVYADFETIVEPITLAKTDPANPFFVESQKDQINSERSFTIKTHKHHPYSFAYYIKCDFDDTKSEFRTHRGQDAQKKFVEMLEKDCKDIFNKYLDKIIPMTPLTSKQETEFDQAKQCHICEKPFNDRDKKVRDHCHLTGAFRGVAHVNCNLNFKIPTFIPVFFHNMSGFDSHLFIKELAECGADLDVIAQNKEKYISFAKKLLVKSSQDQQKNVFLKMRFLDSFRFMASSLDELSNNLKSEQCREVKKHFCNEEEFQLIRQKGVFPYSYVDSFSKLDDTKLPSIDEFYDKLKKEPIKQENYERALKVWNLFKCKTLGEYSDIYLKSDVLLLADVFESFRDVCLTTYGLDPCQYFTAPALSFDSALKTTSVELELLTDLDMVHFLKHGIRGGVSQCSVRKAEANNEFIPQYDATKPTSYIMYLDATNLYGAAMSQYLPTGNFKWLTESEIQSLDITNLAKDSNTGYVFEVDLEYPQKLHHLHNQLPFCPESIKSPVSKTDIKKLIPNLYNKIKYVIHYQNLQQAIKNGLILIKIHRVLSFDQSPWLKKYIDLNTAKRNNAANKFEKNFFKLMNNAVFGKTMENVEKRVDVKLVTHWENRGRRLGFEALSAKPHFKTFTRFTEDFVAVHMAKQKVFYDKPIYVGFCILDISKTIIYDFLYSFIKPEYGEKAVLLYTDTDSLILHAFTQNFYDDMKANIDKFDTSNYTEDNLHGVPVNASVLGRMKDEYAGKIVWDFYGTGAKAYCVNVEGELTKKAKGVPHKDLTQEDYKQAVDVEGTQILRKMNTFRSHEHNMYVELKNKVALSYADDKRRVIPGQENTLAWGHFEI